MQRNYLSTCLPDAALALLLSALTSAAAAQIPDHLVGKHVDDLDAPGKILVVGVDRGGSGFIPELTSTFQDNDVAHVVLHKDAVDLLDELMAPIGDH